MSLNQNQVLNAPTKLDPLEFRLMRDYIEKHCGICLTEEKTYLVETRLTTLMVECGCVNFAELYRNAVADTRHVLRDKIIDAITTHETLWLRDQVPFAIMEKVVLPEMVAQIRAGKRTGVRLWSAGCATGQEPYSIAMTVLEFCRTQTGLRPEQFKIVSTDISGSAMYLAAAGRYDMFSMSRGLPDNLRDRYFNLDGKVWTINECVKKMVEFRKHNLQDSYSDFGRQDIIFCRNVSIYFSEEFKRDMFVRMAQLLRPNGYFFLGGSESLTGYSSEYQMRTFGRGMYYVVKDRPEGQG
jgi:chemotaxis protein methyltransferase CheR